MRKSPLILIDEITLYEVERGVFWQFEFSKKGGLKGYSDDYWCVKEQILAELLGLDCWEAKE